MKTIFKNFIYCLFLMMTSSSCEKFLDVRPDNSGSINPRTVEDFEEILNIVYLADLNFLVADLVSDDIQLTDKMIELGGENSFYTNAYLWKDAVWGPADDDYMYNETYKSILNINIVLDNIMTAYGGTKERKEIVQAQSKIHRAYYYSQLVNIYGTDYQKATAASDLAVPLILRPNPTEMPSRATVEQVYSQILLDLNDAVNEVTLPDFGVDIIHPGKAAAYALLARTYLMMGDFEKALLNAEASLTLKNTLLDYRLFSFVNGYNVDKGVTGKPVSLEDQKGNPEVLFAKVCLDKNFYSRFGETLQISTNLLNLYKPQDLRLIYNFLPTTTSTGKKVNYPLYSNSNGTYNPFNYSIGVPEMMLIKAECLARSGQDEKALKVINTLREYRFMPATFVQLEIGDSEDVLALVLEERRRELYFKGGIRLFDLKRLNREGKYKKDIERVWNDGKDKTILTALSPRYLMPFSTKLIANNNLIIQNER